jgi:SAM-dependent methyltransferase
MTDVTERWRSERLVAAMYDAGVKHDRVATVGAWAMWGADMRRMFADVARLADVPAGTAVLDIPCGGGFAFRGLRPGQAVHYVAADISPYMLGQARQEAGRRGVQDAIEFVEADVTALQFDAFTPTPDTALPKTVRDQFNYRIQLGYTRYFLPGSFYRSYDMPNPWPWALLTPLQIPINLTIDLLAHQSARIARSQDRFARWRRNTWFRNEMGDRDAHFKAAETFRR